LIAKIRKNFDSHDGFLWPDQDSAENCRQMGWIGCYILGIRILQVAQKEQRHREISISCKIK
jgi:hypothetical protein